MYISGLTIRNYRNFGNASFEFKKGVNTIIGENGSGKTNLFRAMRFLIDCSMPRQLYFSEKDFNKKIEDCRGHWIIISMNLCEVDISEECQIFINHATGKMDGTQCGNYTMFFRPKKKKRQELFEYSQREDKNVEGLKTILDGIDVEIDVKNDNAYEVVWTCRSNSDFCDDNIYKDIVGDFENIIFPDPNNEDETILGSRPPSGIFLPNQVSCTFIKAIRDVECDLKMPNKSPLIKLMKNIGKDIREEDINEIRTGIARVNGKITSLDEINKIKDGVHITLDKAVGSTYAPHIEIRSEYSDKIKNILQSLKLWAGDSGDEDVGDINDLSLGGANMLYLSMKLLEYEKMQSESLAGNFLLIEEPEAHIHTHIQKTFFENVQDKTQVFISTHSTHISSVAKISKMNILQREKNEAIIANPSKGLSSDEITRLERYLDAVRSNLLFAKGVVLVEGDAEQILIPAMFKKAFGITLDEIGVSIVNIGSTGFKNVANIFHKDRIRKRCAIITDGDQSIYPVSDKSDKAEKARKSEEVGVERKNDLLKYTKSNKFVEPFFADHTFEVDFISAGNEHEVSAIIEKTYTDPATISKAKVELASKDIFQYGDRVLTMAKKSGKGWFALLLSEQLFYNTYFPDYILKALAFASKNILDKTKQKMVNHVIKEKLKAAHPTNDFNDKASDIVDEFMKKLPDEQLTKFLGLI